MSNKTQLPKSRGAKCWYQPRMSADKSELLIYGQIGGEGISAADFRTDFLQMLDADPRGVRIRINSPGGDLFAGVAIYNCIKACGKPIEMWVDGVAASMASIVACAGSPVIMPRNSFMMIHNPMWDITGDSGDLLSAGDALRGFTDAMADIYAARTGKTRAEMLIIMDAETWLTADDALQLGMCNQVVDSARIAACVGVAKYRKAPQSLVKEQITVAEETPKAETAEAITARITAEIEAKTKERIEEISALCKLAGKPEAAAGYIAGGNTAKEVRDLLMAAPPRQEINPRSAAPSQSSEISAQVAADLNPRRVYQRWNTPKGRKVPADYFDLDRALAELANR